VLTRESLAFDERGDALAPALRGRSRSCCSVAETDRVVVVATPEGAAAPDGNSSAESVAASSSLVTVTEEPFAVATELPIGSADLG
jgi:hypothetical protein